MLSELGTAARTGGVAVLEVVLRRWKTQVLTGVVMTWRRHQAARVAAHQVRVAEARNEWP
jgi:hypothetical protein